jgi:hypothetical protein
MGRSRKPRKKAAQIVIEIALTRATLDAAEIRDDTIGLMREESTAVPAHPSHHATTARITSGQPPAPAATG